MKQRTIPLTVDARKVIARYPAERQRPDLEDFLFFSPRTGSRLSSKAVRQATSRRFSSSPCAGATRRVKRKYAVAPGRT